MSFIDVTRSSSIQTLGKIITAWTVLERLSDHLILILSSKEESMSRTDWIKRLKNWKIFKGTLSWRLHGVTETAVSKSCSRMLMEACKNSIVCTGHRDIKRCHSGGDGDINTKGRVQ